MRRRQVLRLTNAARRRAGLRPLRRSPILNRSATIKAKELAASGRLAHGRWAQLIDRVTRRRFGGIGENIAARQDTAEQVVREWLDSPTHRRNILGDFTHLGVGFARRGDAEAWAQHFGAR